jgi:hypothetical protein
MDGGDPALETRDASLKDTGTQLEFCPRVMPTGPRFWWATHHPLGVRRLAYAQDLAAYGDMLRATAFRVRSPAAAEKHLAGQGIPIIGRDDHTILADPQKTSGAPSRFTTWDVPGDPRN